ncbi:hypothetical protein Y1Q_0003211 [Alligator mississippiensis]|uniref:Uncharacterized protein n=1 Tax=Alligator mississippiensis TaxID=8496 RepID=A0A151MDV8_ALLMI|nr:hypothetical protein Y1Q_0003211 [Alligator mississippiensis]
MILYSVSISSPKRNLNLPARLCNQETKQHYKKQVNVSGHRRNPSPAIRKQGGSFKSRTFQVQLSSQTGVEDRALPPGQVTGRGRPEPYKPQVEKAKGAAKRETPDDYGAVAAAFLGRMCHAVRQKHKPIVPGYTCFCEVNEICGFAINFKKTKKTPNQLASPSLIRGQSFANVENFPSLGS